MTTAALAQSKHVATVQRVQCVHLVALAGEECVIRPPRHVLWRIKDARADIVAQLAAELGWPLDRVQPRFRLAFSGRRRAHRHNHIPVAPERRYRYGEVMVVGWVAAYQRPPSNQWFKAPAGVRHVEWSEPSA